jgi:ribosomal protein S18 acetylase RimI-like enzyme
MPDATRTLSLRPFVLADAGAIEPLLAGPGLSVPGGSLRRQWPQRLLADARIQVLVAEANGQRLGFVRLDCGPDDIAEVTLVVAPNCRRAGIGSAIFAAAMEHARRRGLRGLVASIDASNAAALAFFADQGFALDGLVGGRVRMRRFVHAGDHAQPLDIG